MGFHKNLAQSLSSNVELKLSSFGDQTSREFFVCDIPYGSSFASGETVKGLHVFPSAHDTIETLKEWAVDEGAVAAKYEFFEVLACISSCDFVGNVLVSHME